jgi:hypothetical protein
MNEALLERRKVKMLRVESLVEANKCLNRKAVGLTNHLDFISGLPQSCASRTRFR